MVSLEFAVPIVKAWLRILGCLIRSAALNCEAKGANKEQCIGPAVPTERFAPVPIARRAKKRFDDFSANRFRRRCAFPPLTP